MLESKYRYLLGDEADVASIEDGTRINVSFTYNDNLKPLYNKKKQYLGWTHSVQSVYSDLFFNLSDPQNPIVTHQGVEYIYDPSDYRRKEVEYQEKQSYTVLLGGGKTATAISRSYTIPREEQVH